MWAKRKADKRVPKKEERHGFTKKEKKIHDKLMECNEEFNKLDKQHPDEAAEFTDAMHKLQTIFAFRVLRRTYPKGYPTYVSVKVKGG